MLWRVRRVMKRLTSLDLKETLYKGASTRQIKQRAVVSVAGGAVAVGDAEVARGRKKAKVMERIVAMVEKVTKMTRRSSALGGVHIMGMGTTPDHSSTAATSNAK